MAEHAGGQMAAGGAAQRSTGNQQLACEQGQQGQQGGQGFPGFHPGYGGHGDYAPYGGGRGCCHQRGGFGGGRRGRGRRGRGGYAGRNYGNSYYQDYGGNNYNNHNDWNAQRPRGGHAGGFIGHGPSHEQGGGSLPSAPGVGQDAAHAGPLPVALGSAPGQATGQPQGGAAPSSGGPPNHAPVQIGNSSNTAGIIASELCVSDKPAGGFVGKGSSIGQTNMNIDSNSNIPAAPKTNAKNKPLCYRCLAKGHEITECTSIISCGICDSDNHVTRACPAMKGAKPTATLCGYAFEGLGFYYIPHSGKQKGKVEPRQAIVSVTSGDLTMAQVTVELERLVPGWKWVLEEGRKKSYVTTFPSTVELSRMVEWGPVQAKFAKGVLEISKKKDTEIYKYEVPKCWVQCRGLPKDLREFPIIWAVGTIIGATRKVDMKFTKTFGRARLKVAALAPERIPELVDVVIGDYVFELQFLVETEEESKNPSPIYVDEQPKDEGNKEQEKKDSEKKSDGKSNEMANSDQTPLPPPTQAPGNSAMQRQAASSPTLGRNSAPAQLGAAQGQAGTSAKSRRLASKPAVMLKQTGDKQPTKQWVLERFYGPPTTPEKAQKDNSSPAENITPTRKSKRNAATADSDSLEKATKLKARKNLKTSEEKGTVLGNILAPILDSITALG